VGCSSSRDEVSSAGQVEKVQVKKAADRTSPKREKTGKHRAKKENGVGLSLLKEKWGVPTCLPGRKVVSKKK